MRKSIRGSVEVAKPAIVANLFIHRLTGDRAI